jgi:hypothetical protein
MSRMAEGKVYLGECAQWAARNPATLARDLKELQDKLRINSVTPLDMFPQTAEIEVAVQLHA